MLSLQLHAVLIFLNLIGLFSVAFFLYRLNRHYQSLTSGVVKKDLLSSLNQLINKTDTNRSEIQALKKDLDGLAVQSKNHLQKIGFKRFNPFTDTGGNQSFILTFLDENQSGIVISSLHSRENTRVYAKRILKGKSQEQVLSKDELEVVKDSLK